MNKNCLFVIVIFISLLSNCSDQDNKKSDNTENILKIYNWEEYIGSDTIEKFTEKTNITVLQEFYEDEEEMFALIRSDLSAFDLVIASDDLVREMILGKVLSKINLQKIPNIKNISSEFLNLSYDPEQEYSVPYLWGTTGMVINTKYIDSDEKSWSVLFSEKYSGRIAMLNNPYEVLSAPLKLAGYSINTADRTILVEAEKKLTEQQKIIKGYYDAVSIADMLVSEEIWAAQIYSGEGISASDENENLFYIIPEEGAPIWLDNFVILRDAENVEEAHLFLNFILEAEINGDIASELWYATANNAALKYIDSEVLEFESVFPDEETLSRCEYYRDIGEATGTVVEIWNRLNRSDNQL